ncbi:MAG: Dabb family protein [Clostridia bacterium]|nr:Dabb family protein [Clostridia bacterium]
MIRHIVVYWLKEKNETLINETVELFLSMRGKIPGLLSVEAGADLVGSARSCDLCLCTTLESMDALQTYLIHPVHLPVKEHMHAIMERSASADFEIPAE